MLSLKLVRSLVLGETITPSSNPQWPRKWQLTAPNPSEDSTHHDEKKLKPLILFVPTNELVHDSFRLAEIAREIGMNFSPDPSLSNLLFSWPWPLPPSSSSTHVSLPFPTLASATTSQLRRFVRLARGMFKLVQVPFDSPILRNHSSYLPSNKSCSSNSSFSLFSRLTKGSVEDMDEFARILAGKGWSLFKMKDFQDVYLFRKLDSARVRVCWNTDEPTQFRIRELILPHLDLGNAPLEILHYIVLMTEDIFYLA